MEFLLVFVICLAASTAGGICGIGGGVIIKPVLDVLGLMNVSAASFLSGLTVLSMAAVNVWRGRKSACLDMRRSIPLGLGAALGGIAGKRLFDVIRQSSSNEQIAGVIQAAVLGLLVTATCLYTLYKSRIRTKRICHPAPCALVGVSLGVFSSLLGIGGGPMNLVVLSYFFSMGTKTAAMNSLLIILISQCSSLFITVLTGTIPPVQLPMLAGMVLSGIAGGSLSAAMRKRISIRQTDRMFLAMLIVILAICVYNIIRLSL